MRFFNPDDMKPGLKIRVTQRDVIYRVLEINGDRVKYESTRGTDPWYENEMPLEVFVAGMEEVFALIDEQEMGSVLASEGGET